MNVGTLLTKSAQTFGEDLAIAYGSKKLNYAQFNARANRLASALCKLGVHPSDHVGLLMYNRPEMLEAMFATFKAGGGAVPINFRLHPNEFAYIIDHSQATALVISSEFNEQVMALRDQIPNVRHIITVSGAEGEQLDYEEQVALGSDQFEDVEVAPDDTAWIFYTSGTTGQPKGAMLTHRNLLAMTMNFYADMCPAFGRNEVILHAAPLSHGSGLYALPNVGKAAAHVILESKSFDPVQVFKAIENDRVTNMFAAPTMVKRLLADPAIGDHDLGSLKAVVYGGAPMLVEDLMDAMKKLGPCLVQLYGLGESPMTISFLCHQDHMLEGSQEQMKRLASAGLAHTDVEVAIFDAQDNELGSGEMGQIVTRSDVVMKGYWRDPQATAETLSGGWLHTGDMGYIDDRGYLFIMERSKDMIISGGENIYPREIEEVLVKHPAVKEVAVIGIPDPTWGEAIKAVVATADGATVTEAELIEFCKDNIASYKKPKSVDFVAELPKNNYGKVVKRDLRAPYWEGKQRKV